MWYITRWTSKWSDITQIAKFMGPTWGPPGSCRPQVGLMLAPWTLLSGNWIYPWSVAVASTILWLHHAMSRGSKSFAVVLIRRPHKRSDKMTAPMTDPPPVVQTDHCLSPHSQYENFIEDCEPYLWGENDHTLEFLMPKRQSLSSNYYQKLYITSK